MLGLLNKEVSLDCVCIELNTTNISYIRISILIVKFRGQYKISNFQGFLQRFLNN